MNYLKIPLVALLIIGLTGFASISSTVSAQGSTALERGYRTGYSDGYSSGIADAGAKAARDYQSKEEYQKGNRSFNDVWGPIEDYRDGYQQGFESGYSAGYDQKQFDSTIPTGLRRRQQSAATAQVQVDNAPVMSRPDTTAAADSRVPC